MNTLQYYGRQRGVEVDKKTGGKRGEGQGAQAGGYSMFPNIMFTESDMP
jgi:hypothetical protein